MGHGRAPPTTGRRSRDPRLRRYEPRFAQPTRQVRVDFHLIVPPRQPATGPGAHGRGCRSYPRGVAPSRAGPPGDRSFWSAVPRLLRIAGIAGIAKESRFRPPPLSCVPTRQPAAGPRTPASRRGGRGGVAVPPGRRAVHPEPLHRGPLGSGGPVRGVPVGAADQPGGAGTEPRPHADRPLHPRPAAAGPAGAVAGGRPGGARGQADPGRRRIAAGRRPPGRQRFGRPTRVLDLAARIPDLPDGIAANPLPESPRPVEEEPFSDRVPPGSRYAVEYLHEGRGQGISETPPGSA